MAKNELRIKLTIDASMQKVWERIADWEDQGTWMLQTRVWIDGSQREGVGTRIAAFTGPLHRLYPRFARFGVLDLMEVTQWNPPGESAHCRVVHYGKIIKGEGDFTLSRTPSGSTLFEWSESVEAPRAIFLLIAPFLYMGVLISLRRFRRSVSAS